MGSSLHTSDEKNRRKNGLKKENQFRKRVGQFDLFARLWCRFFGNVRGIIFIDYLQKGYEINGEYYANLLQSFTHEIKNKQRENELFQDNAPVRTFDQYR